MSRPSRLYRDRRVALKVSLLLAFAALLLLSASASAKSARVEVISPKPGARVGGKQLTAEVKVSTKARFRATIGGTDVSKRFKRKGGVLTAQLRRGRDFRGGENYLLVATGKGVARRAITTEFVARKRAAGLLSVKTPHRRPGGPLQVKLKLGGPASALTLKLNGHKVDVGPADGPRSRTIALGASDGLRFGRNSLTAEAEDAASGRFDSEQRSFDVDKAPPLVGAGPDRDTRSGRSVVLDGSSTRRGTMGAGLAYRWKIVAKPARSKARIADSTAKVAHLLPDIPGTYRVQLVAGPASRKTLTEERTQASASASSAPSEAAEPTCLVPLQSPPSNSGSSAGSSAAGGGGEFLNLEPMSSPACVTPVGDASTPLLPPESRPAAVADELTVIAGATDSPMGWPIETIAADHSIRIGSVPYGQAGGWARLLVLGDKSLLPEAGAWGSGNQSFSISQGKQLAEAVERTTNKQIVVLTGMGIPQSGAPKSAEEGLARAIGLLGGEPPSSSETPDIIASGAWSAIGSRDEPGRLYTNLSGLTSATPPGMPGAALPGSINGYMQEVLVGAFSYVSPEFLPLNTQAAGSSNTVSVFTIGAQKLTSETITNGSLAIHLVALDTAAVSGALTPLENKTYVIDNPYFQTNEAGVKPLAEALQRWRDSSEDVLLIMQTFGEGAVGPSTAPGASKYWVNDNLIPENEYGLFEWNGQPYVKAKNESELDGVLDKMWNPGYPTVAGQVGDLTGYEGHDLVSALGGPNSSSPEVTRLSMVASNHPENASANFVSGYAAPAPGRVSGLLVRTPEGGWTLQSGAAEPTFEQEAMWKIAYAPPTPWPLSEGAENKAAMVAISEYLFGSHSQNLREEYVEHFNLDWEHKRRQLERMRYQSTSAYSRATFQVLRSQLEIEMEEVEEVKVEIEFLEHVFERSGNAGTVKINALASKIVDEAVEDAKKREKSEVGISPEAIISESLYTAADLLGFPEVTEELKVAESVGIVAGAFGLVEASTPEKPEEAEGPDSSLINARAGELGVALEKHFELTTDSLRHLGELFVSDWGKLQAAGAGAGGPWSLSVKAEETMEQSLAVSTSQQLYPALLPLTYEQWVVAPYFTETNPGGPTMTIPHNPYKCREYEPAYKDEKYSHPFEGEPVGGTAISVYRPGGKPGSEAPPAKNFTTPFTLRGLKNGSDNLEVHKIEPRDGHRAVVIHHDGSNPPSALIDPLFQPISSGEANPNFPRYLGMSKTAFYAGFASPTEWKRAICAED
jgi:hypothetical protein